MVEHALRNGSPDELAKGLWNDLEPEAIRRCPRSAYLQAHLRDMGCLGARVSGSGPAVFGLCRDREQARDVAARLRDLKVPERPRMQPGGLAWRVSIIQTA